MEPEPPKKKRKLLIVDVVEGETVPVVPPPSTKDTGPTFSPSAFVGLEGIGPVHAKLQQYILKLAEYYRYSGDIDDRVWIKADKCLSATTPEEANTAIAEAAKSAQVYFLSLWGSKKAAGPATPESFEKQAKSAESLAKMFEKKGDDEAAQKQRDRAEQLRAQKGTL